MQTKTTLLLLLLAAATVGGIVMLEQSLPSNRDRIASLAAAFTVNQQTVDHIEVRFEDDRQIALAQKDGLWRIAEPYDDMADPEKVNRLISALSSIEIIEPIDRDDFEDEGWKMTGLSGPAAKVRALSGATTVAEFWLGAAAPLENSAYLMLPPSGDEPEHAYMVRTDLLNALKVPQQDWRDMKLIHLPADLITRLTFTQADGQIEVSRKDSKSPWNLQKPIQTRAGKERINELLAALLNLDITTATVPDLPAATTQPAASPPDPDQLKVTVDALGLPQPWEITIKKPATETPTTTTAQCSHRRAHFTITSKALQQLWFEPNALRDDHLTRVDSEALTHLRIISTAFSEVEIKKDNNAWLINRLGKWEPANGERVLRSFAALNESKVREFTSDSASDLVPFGLASPFLTLSWTEQAKNGPAHESTLHLGQSADATAFYAKYEEEPFIYRINANILPDIPPDPLKWKGLNVLRFSQFALRQITVRAGAQPPTVLGYDPTTSAWTCAIAEKDVTSDLSRTKADVLAGLLSRFTAQSWSANGAEAHQALENPALQVQVMLGEPGKNTGPTKAAVLSFAPTQPGVVSALFYGRLNEGPDVFYVAKDVLAKIAASVLNGK